MFSLFFAYGLFTAIPNYLRDDLPVLLIVLVSISAGFLMVVLFRYTSDQKAIHAAKEQLKAHLLAVRLFQDQMLVVLRSYGRILLSIGKYLRLSFRPLFYVILPLTLLIILLDRYLGFVPLITGDTFLVKVHTTNLESLNEASLKLPSGMTTTAPAVHVPSDNEIIWRVLPEKDGNFDVNIVVGNQTFSKQTAISSGVARVSSVRLRGPFWQRIFVSSEPALPDNGPIQSIEVSYPARSIHFAWLDWNWVWLFFILSLAAGFFFKTVLRIEI